MKNNIEKYTTWIEKNISKHKHCYCIHCILEERELGKNMMGNKYFTNYYNVLMCDKCHSFKMMSERNNIEGHIVSQLNNSINTLTKTQQELPQIIGIRNSNKHGLSNIEELYFPDKTIWKKTIKWKKC